MKRLHLIILKANTNDILLFQDEDGLKLPSIKSNNNKKDVLIKYAKECLGIKNIKKEYLSIKYENKNNIYYYCFEPYFDNEINTKENIAWYDIRTLKDSLSNTSLINALSKVLKSNFSFSKKERDNMISNINLACEEDNYVIANYYNEIGLNKLTNNDKSIHETNLKYQKIFLNQFKDLVKKISIDKLDNIPVAYMTLKEAKIIGKENEWNSILNDVLKMTHFMPRIPANSRFDYYETERQIQNKEDITPKIIADVYIKYRDMDFESIKKDMLKRKKRNS